MPTADEAQRFDRMAEAIFTKALREGRCGEVLQALFDGGSVTIDSDTGEFVFATAAMLAALTREDDDE